MLLVGVIAFCLRLVRELPDGLSPPSRLVQRDERVAVRYLDEPPVREQLGQTVAVLGRHDAVLACPDDEAGALEAGQAFGRFEHEMPLCRDCAEYSQRVAADVAPRQDRLDPAGGGGVTSLRQPAEGDGEPS